MKKILITKRNFFFIPFIFLLIVGCSNDPSPVVQYTPPEELFLRDDADKTLIPLVMFKGWNYVVYETKDKPSSPIQNLLDDDAIEYIRLLPVRQYDNNEGWGKYEYQALCYITSNNKVFFYMDDKIFVGRHLQTDFYGFESVMWDYELPIYSTENSERYFVLNRNATNINEEDYLHEMQGYHTINVKINSTDYREYTECKLFQFQSKNTNPLCINKLYFKHGKGLIRYQQFIISPTDSSEIEWYKQDLVEDF